MLLKSLRTFYYCCLIGMCMVLGCAGKQAVPTEVQESLFKEVEEALNYADKVEASTWAEAIYQQGKKHYAEARQAAMDGKRINTIQQMLAKAVDCFRRSANIAEKSPEIFNPIDQARQDALKVEADNHDAENFLQGESFMRMAKDRLSAERTDKAKELAVKSEAFFRQAELFAIKIRTLGKAWDMLEQTRRMKIHRRAPETIHTVRQLAVQAEELIELNRYDLTEAQKLAELAEYEANHAIFLFNAIGDIKQQKISYEQILKEAEAPLQLIGSKMGIETRFHQGLAIPTESILDRIEKLQLENKHLARDLVALEEEVETLRNRQKSQDRPQEEPAEKYSVETITEEELKGDPPDEAPSSRQTEIEQFIAELKQELSVDEAVIFQNSEGHIVISLIGLPFHIGRADIDARAASRLDKAINLISRLPNCNLLVHGHTDSTGSFAKNLQLSYQRSLSVKDYIAKRNLFPSAKITTAGFGESLPIADNNSKEGRQKNRRIELIVVPES